MSEDLVVELRTERSWQVLEVQGFLDVYTAPQFRHTVQEALHHNPWLVVDFSKVTYMDSTGIGILVSGRRRAQAAGGELRLASARGLAAGELPKTIKLYDSVEQAIDDRPDPTG